MKLVTLLIRGMIVTATAALGGLLIDVEPSAAQSQGKNNN
jgi:hypothetical protein